MVPVVAARPPGGLPSLRSLLSKGMMKSLWRARNGLVLSLIVFVAVTTDAEEMAPGIIEEGGMPGDHHAVDGVTPEERFIQQVAGTNIDGSSPGRGTGRGVTAPTTS